MSSPWGVFIASNGDDDLAPGWKLMKRNPQGESLVFVDEALARAEAERLQNERPYNHVRAMPIVPVVEERFAETPDERLPPLPESAYAPGATPLPEPDGGLPCVAVRVIRRSRSDGD